MPYDKFSVWRNNFVSGEMQPKKIFYVWKKTTSKVWKKTQSAKCLEGCVWNTMSGGKPFSGQMSGEMCLEVCPPPCLPPFTLRAQLTATLPKSMGLVICVVHWAFVLCSTNNVKLC